VVTERARLVRIVEDDKPPGSVRRRGVSYKVEFGVDPPRRPEVIADLLPQGFDYGADFGISSYVLALIMEILLGANCGMVLFSFT